HERAPLEQEVPHLHARPVHVHVAVVRRREPRGARPRAEVHAGGVAHRDREPAEAVPLERFTLLAPDPRVRRAPLLGGGGAEVAALGGRAQELVALDLLELLAVVAALLLAAPALGVVAEEIA